MVQDRQFWFLTLEFYPQTQVVIDYDLLVWIVEHYGEELNKQPRAASFD